MLADRRREMSWKFTRAKGMPNWVFGVAWLNRTLYVGFWIYLELHFKAR